MSELFPSRLGIVAARRENLCALRPFMNDCFGFGVGIVVLVPVKIVTTA